MSIHRHSLSATQVLSPSDLQRVASDATCLDAVAEWWRRFHRIDKMLVDFEHVFINKFDTVVDKYSSFDVDQCKVRKNWQDFGQGNRLSVGQPCGSAMSGLIT